MAAEPFTPRDIYRSFRADRNIALHRVLRRLPDRFIAALAEGLEQAGAQDPPLGPVRPAPSCCCAR